MADRIVTLIHRMPIGMLYGLLATVLVILSPFILLYSLWILSADAFFSSRLFVSMMRLSGIGEFRGHTMRSACRHCSGNIVWHLFAPTENHPEKEILNDFDGNAFNSNNLIRMRKQCPHCCRETDRLYLCTGHT